MRYLTIIICFCSLAFGLSWNLNSDCQVNFGDFAIFAEDWQTTYDVNDLASFCTEWLEYDTDQRRPTVSSSELYHRNDVNIPISFTATDDNNDVLTYYLESISDFNAGTFVDINSLPFELTSTSFTFEPNSLFDGWTTITYSADDGVSPCGGKTYGTAKILLFTPGTPVITSDNDVNVLQYVRTKIILEATDDDQPDPPAKLKYIITDLPTNTVLQDPKSGAGIITAVPYTLSTNGNELWLYSETVGMDSFDWYVSDYEYDSNEQTVDVNVLSNPQDCLEFDGVGTITFADNDKYDLADGWAMDFWINTTSPFAGICKKRDANGVGYEFNLVHGKPQFEIYDANGLVVSARSATRLDNGFWNEISAGYHKDVNGLVVFVNAGVGEDYGYGWLSTGVREYWLFEDINDVNVVYANDANLIFGQSSYGSYRGLIDKIRFFDSIAYPMAFDLIQGLAGRTDNVTEQVLGFGAVSDVVYPCDEGSGTIISDSKAQGECPYEPYICEDIGWNEGAPDGIISDTNNVQWTPSIQVFTDNSVIKYYQFMERRKW